MRTRLEAFAGCVLAVAVASGAIAALDRWVPVLSLAILYLLAVLPVAIVWGIGPAVLVSVGSMLTFNFFFLPPVHTFTLADSQNWLALVVFAVTAVVVGELAARARRRAREAALLAERATTLADERERLAQEALEAEALRRADALKTALLRAVSHDLRTPLMAISTAAGALSRGDLAIDEADRDELLATILAASDRLDHLVVNLLDLSRLQAGAAPPELELVDEEGLVVRALDELGGEARIEVSLPDDAPLVRVDGHQIQRVLVNLIENALKYSSAGEPVRVQVAATPVETLVRVIDHGPGVPFEEREAIFEPFHRGSRVGEARGAGLGLAIARGFAEANGGRISVESRAGQGATFVLSLPSVAAPVTVA